MIDYYLHKHCCLVCKYGKKCEDDGVACSKCRCSGCVWLDKELHKCVFSIEYPKSISLQELEECISVVNLEQQNNLSEPFRRFVNDKM